MSLRGQRKAVQVGLSTRFYTSVLTRFFASSIIKIDVEAKALTITDIYAQIPLPIEQATSSIISDCNTPTKTRAALNCDLPKASLIDPTNWISFNISIHV